MKKRILSIALCAGMLFGCTASVFAEETVQETAQSFSIVKDAASDVDIADLAASRTKISSVTLEYKTTPYTGKALKPAVTVKAKVNGKTKTLKAGTDYTVSYKNNKNVGIATVIVKGKGSYTGTKTAKFKITAAALSSASVKGSPFSYTGKAQKPAVTVKAKVNGRTKTLKDGTDYTATYQNNKNVGTATVTIKGKGNYKGTKTAKFKIAPVVIESADLAFDRMLYTGYPMTQSAVVRATVNGKETVLKEGRDYTIEYVDNTEGPLATLDINGIGNFTGELLPAFEIVEKDVTAIDPVNDWDLYDGLIEMSRPEAGTDPAARVDILHKAEDILMATWAVIPLYYYAESPGTYFIMFNVKADVQAAAVRHAVAILIDRKKIENIVNAEYTASAGIASTFVPVGMPDGNGGIFHESSTDGYFDATAINDTPEETIAVARGLLESAGFTFDEKGMLPEGALKFTFHYNEGGYHEEVVKSIASDLSVIGIEVEPVGIPRDIYWDVLDAGDFTAARGGWALDDAHAEPVYMLEMAETNNQEGGNAMQFGKK